MKKFWALLTVLALVLALVPATAFAASGSAADEAGLLAALGAAGAGDTVTITAGFVWSGTSITVPAGVTVAGASGVTITISGGNNLFVMNTGSTVTGLTIAKTDAATQQIINMAGNNCTLSNCNISGQYNPPSDPDVVRGIVMTAGCQNLLITGNRFSHLRQPAYCEGTGVISNNYVEYTKGWVICDNSQFTFTGNTFANNNPVDMAIIDNVPNSDPNNYAGTIVAMSANNGGALVEDQVQNATADNGAYVLGTGARTTLAGALADAALGGKAVTVPADYTAPGPIIIPAGVTLTIPEGVTLTFAAGATNYGTIWNYGVMAGEGILNCGTIYTYRGCEGTVMNNTSPGAPLGRLIYLDKALFQIDIITGAGGTSNPISPVFAAQGGSSPAITFTPNAGYFIKDVKVDGASIGAVASYTFTNVQANHKIEVIFATGTAEPPQTGDSATLAGFAMLALALAAAVVAGVKRVCAK